MTRPVYRVSELATMLNVSPDFIWTRIRSGELQAKKLGRWTVVTQASLDSFIANLPSVTTDAAPVATAQVEEKPEQQQSGSRQRVQRRISLLPTGSTS